jgi:translocation and assembly module TamA
VSFRRTKSVGGIDPSRGYSLMLDLQGAKEGVVSDVDFAHVFATAKGLYTVEEKHRLLARLGLGAVYTNDFEQIPPSLRFFAGGDQTVRGYDYRTLSPVDSTGERVGGRYLLASSVEYQYEFINNWRAASFVDHGNAMDSLAAARKTSVGLGVRWVSPVGPIRVDLARSLSDPEEGFRIHFSMGPEL